MTTPDALRAQVAELAGIMGDMLAYIRAQATHDGPHWRQVAHELMDVQDRLRAAPAGEGGRCACGAALPYGKAHTRVQCDACWEARKAADALTREAQGRGEYETTGDADVGAIPDGAVVNDGRTAWRYRKDEDDAMWEGVVPNGALLCPMAYNGERHYDALCELYRAKQRVETLTRERDEKEADFFAVEAECNWVSTALDMTVGHRFMDPPDGGSVTLGEQVERMGRALLAAESRLAGFEALAGRAKVEWEAIQPVRDAENETCQCDDCRYLRILRDLAKLLPEATP